MSYSRLLLPLASAAVGLLPLASFASDPPRKIPAADLQSDLAILQRAYEAIHPGLYRYNTREGMAANFATLRSDWSRDLTLPEAYLALSTFLAKVRCGHTYANFFNQTDAVADELFKKPGHIPFCFRWLDRRMIVTRDLSGREQTPVGTEILALNGVPVAQILDRLLTVARADGSNDAKRIAGMEVHGDSRFEAFDIYLPLFYPTAGKVLELRLRWPDGQDGGARVAWQTYAGRLASIKTSTGEPGANEPLWTLTFPNSRLARLTMPTWATYNSKWNWKKFLDETFIQLAERQTPNLVLDLRGNEGGADEGEYLLGKLIRKDLALDDFKRLVRYRKVPADLAPYLDTWDPSFKDWGNAATQGDDGYFVLHRYDDAPGASVVRASAKPYGGRVFVLIDANNSSATFQFAQTMQREKLGTLVGQPTGGNQRGINGGAFFFLRLPKSGLEAELPIVGLFPPGNPPDAGLTPDVTVKPSVADIASGTDAELAAVARLIDAAK